MTTLLNSNTLSAQYMNRDLRSNGEFLLYGSNNKVLLPIGYPDRDEQKSEQIKSRITQLCSLPVGWDGEYAQPVSRKAGNKAAYVTYAVSKDYIDLVQFFPLPNGGIQIEFLVGGNELEIEIDENGNAFVVATDNSGYTKFEGEFELRDSNMLVKITEEVKNLALMVK